MGTLLTLLRKELYLYAVSPLTYVVAAVFVGLCGFFFYTRLIVYSQFGFGWDILGNFWFSFLAGAPYSVSTVLLLMCPLLTMRSFAEERRTGTLELLLTLPLGDAQLVLAKWLAALLVVEVILGLLLPFLVALHGLAAFPWQPAMAGFLGLVLLASAFVAAGVCFSACTSSQVIAAAATYGLLVLAWLVTWNEAAAGEPWMRVLREVSLFDRFEWFARGVVRSGDAAYFLACTAFFLCLAGLVLGARRWRGK
ncbi:MAG: ABC transporter permease [Candidatus Binatia bacterium]|nr:MAG: ABC transporter permease [Candidatus Binatia bacterium]